MTVQIKSDGQNISVYSPYNPDFPRAAKQLGGKWDPAARAWTFDARDEQRVRDLCVEIYGTDGNTPTGDLITIRVTVKPDSRWYADKGGLFFAGRCVAYARGRDSGARLGDGVVVLEGGFKSGGSMKNWTTKCSDDGAVFEIRDVPRAKAIEAKEASASYIDSVEIIEQNVSKSALEEEKQRLLARIAEIDALLAGV